MSKSLTVVLVVAIVLSVGGNGYLYMLLQRSPEVVYLQPEAPEQPVEGGFVHVHVSGAVRSPGVYTLPTGSRAINAVEKAGGSLQEADLESVNLARVLFDGEQLHIYLRQEVGQEATAPVIQTDTRININTATQAELEKLPNIGPTKATAIIAYRTQNGSFRTPEDLMKVSGIAEKTYDSLKHLIRIK